MADAVDLAHRSKDISVELKLTHPREGLCCNDVLESLPGRDAPWPQDATGGGTTRHALVDLLQGA